jgi:hypothetical protein
MSEEIIADMTIIQNYLNDKKINVSNDTVRHSISHTIPTKCKDDLGNYTGSERLLLTPFSGKNDLSKIIDFIKTNYLNNPPRN